MDKKIYLRVHLDLLKMFQEIKLLVMISEGFKVSDFGGGPDHESLPQFQVSEAEIFLAANMPRGTL